MTDPQAERPCLADRIPDGGLSDPDQMLDLFLGWVSDIGFELYPAQEEALLEIMAGNHVILSTPTGSGKSLVALGMHFKAMCEGAVSYYTSPIKALASEKFFALCEDLGAANVGMLTGDASINPEARVICCTAEVLSNLALRRGSDLEAPYVVMDEFHYYADRDRGVAWQIPLITLPRTRFLLMSATLGDMTTISEHLQRQTCFDVAHVHSDDRPVPLEYEYRETPIHETAEYLRDGARLPVYVVNFTQRECAELAQSLTSMTMAAKEERAAVREEIASARFDTPYGRELRRFLGFGIGVHHAGLLPKYRLLVEQLSQRGLLKVISGTDTLGVGVNIPIRSVLFTKLAKFDGRKVTVLKVRDFKQIAGRAGRKGFDERGWVVCQAPEDVIDRITSERKAANNPSKKRKLARKQTPKEGVSWSEKTYENLISRPPERLVSRFKITQGMILDLLGRDAEINNPDARNFASLRRLIAECHEDGPSKARHLSFSAQLIRSLHRAGVIRLARDTATSFLWVVVNEELQTGFSLFHSLSLFMVDAIGRLDPTDPRYPLTLVSLVECVLEDPTIVLRRQVDRIKTQLVADLKAEGATYEERIAALDQVTHPQPDADFIYAAFDRFRGDHPWVGARAIHPKSVAREMLEECTSFTDYVRHYGLQRFEGVLLRYLSQVYKTLVQNVPDWAKTDEVHDVIGFFRAIIERIDTSLLEEWESLLHPELRLAGVADSRQAHRMLVAEELRQDTRALGARIRAELHQLVRALARRDWEEAELAIRQIPDDPETRWDATRFESELEPFFAEHDELVFDHEARLADKTSLERTGDLTWKVAQTLVDPDGDNMWFLECTVDLGDVERLDGPLVALRRIGT